ncbi:MAG: type II toxin-antitoxin system VapB family antitoxin [Nitrospirae bacterium]|nr:type II toxin-antitoxin system VapB family antitoxin [Nitrospirota bacterium]
MSRTVLNIDDSLYEEARLYTGLKKKVDVVNYALKRLLEQRDIEKVLELRGNIHWEGVLEEMRRGRRHSHTERLSALSTRDNHFETLARHSTLRLYR